MLILALSSRSPRRGQPRPSIAFQMPGEARGRRAMRSRALRRKSLHREHAAELGHHTRGSHEAGALGLCC